MTHDTIYPIDASDRANDISLGDDTLNHDSPSHDTSSHFGIAELNFKASRQRILTAPLPDPITKNIEAVIALHTQKVRDIPAHQWVLEEFAAFFGRSVFMYGLLAGLSIWIMGDYINHTEILSFKLPSFIWADYGLDAAALLISTGVLVRQSRQESFAEQRAQLMLQLNLLSEQKIAKIIALLEELRTDLPNVIDRHDPEAQVMQEAADPIAVLETLQDNLEKELSPNHAHSTSTEPFGEMLSREKIASVER